MFAWLKKPPTTPGLPSLMDTKNPEVTTAANREGERVIAESASRKRKRGMYGHHSPEMRVKIARMGVGVGTSKAARRLSAEVGGKMNESTVRSTKNSYTKELKRLGTDSIENFPRKNTGRPLMLGDLDEEPNGEIHGGLCKGPALGANRRSAWTMLGRSKTEQTKVLKAYISYCKGNNPDMAKTKSDMFAFSSGYPPTQNTWESLTKLKETLDDTCISQLSSDVSDEESETDDNYTWMIRSPTWRSKRLNEILLLCDTELDKKPGRNKKRTRRLRSNEPCTRSPPDVRKVYLKTDEETEEVQEQETEVQHQEETEGADKDLGGIENSEDKDSGDEGSGDDGIGAVGCEESKKCKKVARRRCLQDRDTTRALLALVDPQPATKEALGPAQAQSAVKSKGAHNKSKGADDKSKGADDKSKGADDRSKGADDRSKNADKSEGAQDKSEAAEGKSPWAGPQLAEMARMKTFEETVSALVHKIDNIAPGPARGVSGAIGDALRCVGDDAPTLLTNSRPAAGPSAWRISDARNPTAGPSTRGGERRWEPDRRSVNQGGGGATTMGAGPSTRGDSDDGSPTAGPSTRGDSDDGSPTAGGTATMGARPPVRQPGGGGATTMGAGPSTSGGNDDGSPTAGPSTRGDSDDGSPNAGPSTRGGGATTMGAGPSTRGDSDDGSPNAGPSTSGGNDDGSPTAGPSTSGGNDDGSPTAGPSTRGDSDDGSPNAGPPTAGPSTSGGNDDGSPTAGPSTSGGNDDGSPTAGPSTRGDNTWRGPANSMSPVAGQSNSGDNWRGDNTWRGSGDNWRGDNTWRGPANSMSPVAGQSNSGDNWRGDNTWSGASPGAGPSNGERTVRVGAEHQQVYVSPDAMTRAQGGKSTTARLTWTAGGDAKGPKLDTNTIEAIIAGGDAKGPKLDPWRDDRYLQKQHRWMEDHGVLDPPLRRYVVMAREVMPKCVLKLGNPIHETPVVVNGRRLETSAATNGSTARNSASAPALPPVNIVQSLTGSCKPRCAGFVVSMVIASGSAIYARLDLIHRTGPDGRATFCLKSHAGSEEHQVSKYSGHSLHCGGATWASDCSVQADLTKLQGDC
ncbi:hypothetical protein Bbelb_318640 [Branchiostoma belcheri]|nr:hypothetical protein Bbelb_318640 [Branchiostoma belcheri]